MRICSVIFAFVMTTATFADAPADIANRTLTNQSSVDEILDALDARGKGFKSFSADVKLEETTTDMGNTTTRFGTVIYQDQGDGRARIRVSFDRVQHNGAKPVEEKLIYELIDGKLIERNYKTKSQVTQQVTRPGEKLDLFKLGQGPFPLPIGQPKEEVHKQFAVKKIDPDKENDPPNTVHLQLTPNPDTRLARKLKTIDTWVEVKTHMPIRIGTRDHNETMDRTTDLSNVKVNPNLTDQDFDLGKLPDPNWNVTDQPFQD